MTSVALHRALTAPADPPLRPLPAQVAELLVRVQAPPRLAAHLRAVHEVAAQLVDALAQRFPQLTVDRAAVLFGAATHDIGKVVHPEELGGPGSAHEPAGRELLLRHGVPASLARFAATHADWRSAGIGVDDLLVSVADKVWKGKRVRDLEDLVVDRLAAATGGERWAVFLELDDVLDRLAADADHRLAFQAIHPVRVD
ncbi:HD domain-containing protein [Micromonospora auratinigra]|uniref:HD domain-containing protein n=1 Tax=Micromonospora auratinigra TaxID=261654 RepID=A0A1A8Z8P6_9ACTN|nr:HD domain-containing protein [Micromonospora auratinigra]SBT40203.1 HD domain-containing protein [Micromonospora auratinigra]